MDWIIAFARLADIWPALIGVGGVVIGALLSSLTALWRDREATKRSELIEIRADAAARVEAVKAASRVVAKNLYGHLRRVRAYDAGLRGFDDWFLARWRESSGVETLRLVNAIPDDTLRAKLVTVLFADDALDWVAREILTASERMEERLVTAIALSETGARGEAITDETLREAQRLAKSLHHIQDQTDDPS